MSSEVPDGWRSVSLGDVIRLEYGRALAASAREPGAIPVYGSNGICGEHSAALVNERGIVVGRKGTAGSVTVTTGAFWPIDTAYYVVPRVESDFDWLAATLENARLSELSEATGVPGLNRDKAYGQRIFLPPPEEQRKIAEVLRSVDDAIAAASKAARQAARTFDSVIASVLGPYAAALGAPNAETAPLANFCQRVTYGFTNPMPTTDNGPWMVTALNVRNGNIDYATARHTSASAYDALTDKSRPSIGAVLVTKDGTLGRVAVVDQPDVCVNQSVAVLEPRQEVLNPLFLSYLLQSEIGQTRMLADSGGGSVKHIYITKLGAMPISVPSFAEQTKIADQVAKCSAAVELAEQSLRQLRQLRISTADDLLTGRVRVPA